MKVLLIAANTERVAMTVLPVGLALVAAATRRAGHDVRLLDLMRAPDPATAVRDAVRELEPDVIGISVRNIDDQCLQAPRFLLDQVKPVMAACRATTRAPIVLGGPGFSLFPAEALAHLGADAGVVGDGEALFPALLDRLARGEGLGGPVTLPAFAGIAPVSSALAGTPGPGIVLPGGSAFSPSFDMPLDDAPSAIDDLASIVDPTTPELWLPVQTRRGCPNDCAYCATDRIQGRTIRAKSVEAVAEELRRAVASGFTRFYVVDNSFNIPESYALSLCRVLRGLGPGVSWRCILYPHAVSETLVRTMAESGCTEVSIGFESGVPEILAALGKRFGPDEVRRVSEMVDKVGISQTGFLLFGAPGETPETVERSLAFADSLPLRSLRITVGIRLYPGTRLARIAEEQGVIEPGANLLAPRFYLAPGLEPWIHSRVTPGFFEVTREAGGGSPPAGGRAR